MRKRIVGQASIHKQPDSTQGWLDLEQLATVEATSEDPDFPIESVFHPSNGPGWRASGKEEQRIRIIFDQPLSIKRIRLRFVEAELERTQEFTISYSGELGGPPKEIVRQQWNFSPAGSTSEVERASSQHRWCFGARIGYQARSVARRRACHFGRMAHRVIRCFCPLIPSRRYAYF
jgi:hypothetical protein